MLIWYANIPEETQYFFHRYQGTWYNVGLILIYGHFLFPFVFLIGRKVKRRFATLGFAAIYLLIICYIDVYWMVMPMLHKTGSRNSLAGLHYACCGGERLWAAFLEPDEEVCAGAGRRYPTDPSLAFKNQ